MKGVEADTLDLQAAADALGVHYQTAYRWVRSGRLKAVVVDGRYVVARSDLDALDAERQRPRGPKAPSARRLERSAIRMHEALAAGDEAAARQLARSLLEQGTPITGVIQAALVPALIQIGQSWQDGELSIWVEHRASAIVERILGELVPNPRGRRRGTAVVAAVSGDHHSLPTLMATVILRDDNWHVHHLGANMPPAELVRFCQEHPITVAVITSTNPDTAELAARAADMLRADGTPTIVGSPGRTATDLIQEARHASSPSAETKETKRS